MTQTITKTIWFLVDKNSNEWLISDFSKEPYYFDTRREARDEKHPSDKVVKGFLIFSRLVA